MKLFLPRALASSRTFMRRQTVGRGVGARTLMAGGSAMTTGETILGTIDDLPGPPAYPIVGAVPSYLPGIGKYDPQRIAKASLLKYREFGPIFKERLFDETIVYLVDPDDIQAITTPSASTTKDGGRLWPNRLTHLVLRHVRLNELSNVHNNGGIFVENGETWLQIRQSFQKSMMTISKIDRFLGSGDELAVELLSSYLKTKDAMAPEIKGLIDKDFLNMIIAYSSDYVRKVLTGERLDSMKNFSDPNAASTRIINAAGSINAATGVTDHGGKLWRFFSTPKYKLTLEKAKVLDEVAQLFLEKRVKDGKLVALADTDSLIDTWIREGSPDYKTLMTFVSDMLLAGVDTMSYTLSFVLYHMSENPDAQDKLYEELKTLNPEGWKEPLTVNMVNSASYMKRCMKEAMRLNPLTLGIGRVLSEDVVLSGYLIPKGTQVVTLSEVTSRLPEYVDDPESFIPERWGGREDTGLRKMHPFVSIPFSHGPRSCVGRRIAEQCLHVFLFRLFREYRLSWAGQRPLEAITELINKPDAPLLFKFTPRTSSS